MTTSVNQPKIDRDSSIIRPAEHLFAPTRSHFETDLDGRQNVDERHLLELFNTGTAKDEPDRKDRASKYLNTLPPLTQLRLLCLFNQPGYVATIDGEYYDQREKWILGYQFNSIAKNSTNALVALTAEGWASRMAGKSEKITTQDLLAYPGGRDLAYRSRIALPEGWSSHAELSYIAPSIIAAKDSTDTVRRIATIEHTPEHLSARDINILFAGYAVAVGRLHEKNWPESSEISVVTKSQLLRNLEGDDLEFVKHATDKYEIYERVDQLTEANIKIRLEDTDFRDILDLEDFADDESRILFQLTHREGVRDALEEASGIDLTALPIATQSKLLGYMTSRTKEEFSRLAAAASNIATTHGSSVEFYEAFLATEFGDDFGDILLDLAETTESHTLHQAVEHIAQVRESGRVIAERFASEDSLDRVIAERIPTAFAKRVTEMLALARQDGVGEVMESLEAVAEASSKIAKGLASGTFTQVDAGTDFGSFGSDALPLTITARPSGTNARLGFTVRGMGASGKERLNIRLDYEDGRLSLDIGSGAKQGVNSSDIARKVGADLARGELALVAYRGAATALHGNHVRETFEDLPDIYPEEFAGVVNRFMYRLKLIDSTDLQTAA